MNARCEPLSLAIDAAAEAERIAGSLRAQVLKRLRRKGIVVGLSGGVDSSVVAALGVRAFGPANLLGVFMPEQESEPDGAASRLAPENGHQRHDSRPAHHEQEGSEEHASQGLRVSREAQARPHGGEHVLGGKNCLVALSPPREEHPKYR